MEQNQKRLKQEGISYFKETRNHGSKRSNDNDDKLSVVSASKRPKVIQGHNNLETLSIWNIPKHQRERRRPTDIYVPESNMNNGGSPTSTINSPLATTTRQTNTSNSNSGDNNSNSDNNFREQSLIESQISLMSRLVTHFGTILSSRIVEGRTCYEIVCDDKFQEEVDSLELSICQGLYYTETENDVADQQKQKARSTLDNEYH